MEPLKENLLLQVSSVIRDEVTTTDELIPAGETASYRSNPDMFSEFTLIRKDPKYVGRAKAAQVYEKAKALGFAFPNIVAPSAYISPYAKLGCGCVVLQNACVQNGTSVGKGVLLNAGTEIHCDAAVGDYALIYTNSVVRTGATVGNFTRIGSNCTICNNATVPDGAAIPDYTAVH